MVIELPPERLNENVKLTAGLNRATQGSSVPFSFEVA